MMRMYDPAALRPLKPLLEYVWLILPAWLASVIIEVQLMACFGRRDEEGRPEGYRSPPEARFEQIEEEG